VSEPTAPDAPVVVYTRAGVDDHGRDVERICAELGLGWLAVDVDGDPELRAEYGDRVPVIMVDGREHGFWKVEEPRLRSALAARAGANPPA